MRSVVALALRMGAWRGGGDKWARRCVGGLIPTHLRIFVFGDFLTVSGGWPIIWVLPNKIAAPATQRLLGHKAESVCHLLATANNGKYSVFTSVSCGVTRQWQMLSKRSGAYTIDGQNHRQLGGLEHSS